jgi:hypothetical protein
MLFVVDQRQFGVVYALGQVKEVISEPGLKFKLPPPLQNVSYIDKRLLTLDSVDTEPMLTAEKQPYSPYRDLDLMADGAADDDPNAVQIVAALENGAYGLDPNDLYLA